MRDSIGDYTVQFEAQDMPLLTVVVGRIPCIGESVVFPGKRRDHWGERRVVDVTHLAGGAEKDAQCSAMVYLSKDVSENFEDERVGPLSVPLVWVEVVRQEGESYLLSLTRVPQVGEYVEDFNDIQAYRRVERVLHFSLREFSWSGPEAARAMVFVSAVDNDVRAPDYKHPQAD